MSKMLKLLATTAVAMSLPFAAAAQAPSSQAAAPPAGMVGALAGMTCVGYFDFGFPAQIDESKGALWFQPDQSGKANLLVKYGRVAMENYDKLSSANGYQSSGPIQLTQQGATIRFVSVKGMDTSLTSTGANTFKLVSTYQGWTWYGKAYCRR